MTDHKEREGIDGTYCNCLICKGGLKKCKDMEGREGGWGGEKDNTSFMLR